MRIITISLADVEGCANPQVEFPDRHVKKRELLVIIKALKLEYKRKVREYRKILIKKASENCGQDSGTDSSREGSGSENSSTNGSGTRDAERDAATGGSVEGIARTVEIDTSTESTAKPDTGISKAEEIRRRIKSEKSLAGTSV